MPWLELEAEISDEFDELTRYVGGLTVGGPFAGMTGPGVAHGEDVGTSKLTDADVLEIRRRSGWLGLSELARAYNVKPPTVFAIVTSETWAHLPAATAQQVLKW